MDLRSRIKLTAKRCGVDLFKLRRLYRFEYVFDESFLLCDFLVNRALVEDGTFVDVGYAWGGATELLLEKGWRGHGFEPDQCASKRIFIEHLIRKHPKLSVAREAVSDTSGECLALYKSSASEGITSLHNFNGHYKDTTVTTITLRDYLSSNHIPDVDYLKVDTEGHDYRVLLGFPFEKMLPKAILVEFDQKKSRHINSHGAQDIVEHLSSLPYECVTSEWHPIQRYGGLHKFRTLHIGFPDLSHSEAWGNILFVRNDYSPLFTDYIAATIDDRFLTSSNVP